MIGESITVSGDPFTVVGVMRPEFEFPVSNIDLWVPLRKSPEAPYFLQVVARLKDRVTLQGAQNATDIFASHIRQLDAQKNAGVQVVVSLWRQEVEPEYERTMVLIFAAVGFVLLIACANVAGLMLGRAVQRQREIAIRSSLGAGRWSIARGLLAESIVLAALGSLAGIVLTHYSLRLLADQLAGLPIVLPHLQHVALNSRALVVCIVLCLLVAGLCSLAAILFVSRTDPHAALRSGQRTMPKGSGPLFSFLVASQGAFTFLLLVGSGLMIHSVIRLQESDKGFRPDHVLTLRVPVGTMRGSRPGDETAAYYQELLDRIERIPGVGAAALVSNLPLSGINLRLTFPGPNGETLLYSVRSISPKYFAVMGIPLVSGRLFTDADLEHAPPVAIVNERLARQLYPDRDPLGQFLPSETPDNRIRIVGVAKNTWQNKYDQPVEAELYVPHRQLMRWSFASAIAVRTAGEPLALADAIRNEVWVVDPAQPILKVETMNTVVSNSIWRPRFSAWVFSVLGVLALLLSAAGVHAIVAYTSALRMREVGIRIAVGATPSAVVALIVRYAMLPLSIGLGAGAVAALLLSRFLSGLLYEVQGADPAAYAGSAAVMLAVGAVASIRPALRAAALEPLSVLGAD